jgi:hypothetical protein
MFRISRTPVVMLLRRMIADGPLMQGCPSDNNASALFMRMPEAKCRKPV